MTLEESIQRAMNYAKSAEIRLDAFSGPQTAEQSLLLAQALAQVSQAYSALAYAQAQSKIAARA